MPVVCYLRRMSGIQLEKIPLIDTRVRRKGTVVVIKLDDVLYTCVYGGAGAWPLCSASLQPSAHSVRTAIISAFVVYML